MKRDFSIITSWMKDNISEWLYKDDLMKSMSCPFMKGNNKRCDICNAAFPKLHKTPSFFTSCPCTKFGLKYVKRVAKEAIK